MTRASSDRTAGRTTTTSCRLAFIRVIRAIRGLPSKTFSPRITRIAPRFDKTGTGSMFRHDFLSLQSRSADILVRPHGRFGALYGQEQDRPRSALLTYGLQQRQETRNNISLACLDYLCRLLLESTLTRSTGANRGNRDDDQEQHLLACPPLPLLPPVLRFLRPLPKHRPPLCSPSTASPPRPTAQPIHEPG
jgi:hypothetical protein